MICLTHERFTDTQNKQTTDKQINKININTVQYGRKKTTREKCEKKI